MAPFPRRPKSLLEHNLPKLFGRTEAVVRFGQDSISCAFQPKRFTDAARNFFSVNRRFGFNYKCSQSGHFRLGELKKFSVLRHFGLALSVRWQLRGDKFNTTSREGLKHFRNLRYSEWRRSRR